ncbi:MAG: hypothetical protein SPI14_06010 [Arcanobacterium sp.]|nr:hypothetical protein [Arcanobacterium sp.]
MDTTVSKPTDEAMPRTPQIEGEYDVERMRQLVANLRSEIDELKTERATLKDQLATLESLKSSFDKAQADLADRDKTINALTVDAGKRSVLAAHGVRNPDDYLAMLTGDTPEDWERSVTLLEQFTAGTTQAKKDGFAPDPVITSESGTPDADAADLALANKIFRN